MVASLRVINEVMGLEIENTPGDLLEFGDQGIEVGRFRIELGEPGACLPQVSN